MTTDAPNTLAGLIRKRREITGKIEHTHRTLSDLFADLDYIDNAIGIIDPECDAMLSKAKRYPPRMGSFRGEMTRFVLGHLRGATEPATTLEIAHAVMQGCGQDTNDVRAVIVLRNRVGACLYKLARKGLVREVACTGKYKRWEMASGPLARS